MVFHLMLMVELEILNVKCAKSTYTSEYCSIRLHKTETADSISKVDELNFLEPENIPFNEIKT